MLGAVGHSTSTTEFIENMGTLKFSKIGVYWSNHASPKHRDSEASPLRLRTSIEAPPGTYNKGRFIITSVV